MSDFIEILGGSALSGEVQISGAKNAALPLLMACLLSSEPCEITNVPNIEDIKIALHLLEHFGAEVEHIGDRVKIHVPRLRATEASYSLVKALRASFWILGPLLARGRAARVALPGGDIIGARPVDMHLTALTQMGADIKVKHGVVFATAVHGLKPATIDLRFPSVGATHQIIMAASLVPGVTTIHGAAREPEIVALCDFICSMGAKIEGAGTSTIVIHGVEQLKGASIRLIGDRIEAGTYILAIAASQGRGRVKGFTPEHLGSFLDVLRDMGVQFSCGEDYMDVLMSERPKPVSVATGPFPLLATDLQAVLMAALCFAEGTSVLEELVYEGRFNHVSELCRLGANIAVEERLAKITGVPELSGAPVEGHDLRGAAALIIAGICAKGVTQLYEPQHARRGYDSLESKLLGLGAKVRYKFNDPEDFVFTGC